MIYTLTFNPSLDYVAYADDMTEGSIHKISDYELYPGGKGINVSQVLKELDVLSVAWGFVAGVTGESLLKLLDEKQIKHDFIELQDGLTRINVKLRKKLEKEVVETDFNGTGPVIGADAISKLTDNISGLTSEDILIISGSFPSSVTLDTFDRILDTVDTTGARLVVDTTGDYLEVALKHRPFLVKPNEEELTDFYKKRHRKLINLVDNTLETPSLKNENAQIEKQDCDCDYESMATAIQKMGASNVLVSLGEKGAMLLAKTGEIYRIQPPKGIVVNTVGAGDSMVAGFVADTNASYEKALRLAVCAGSATAFAKGLATKDSIERLMNEF